MELDIPLADEGFELCHPDRDDDFESINSQIDGTSRSSTWRPIPMHLIHEDDGKALVASDSPWLGSHALIFRPRAVEKLGGILEDHGELLPLRCAEATLVVYNPTRVLDALDEEASSVTRFRTCASAQRS